jgi:hypothetical protein
MAIVGCSAKNNLPQIHTGNTRICPLHRHLRADTLGGGLTKECDGGLEKMRSTIALSAGISSIESAVATLTIMWLAMPTVAGAHPRQLEADTFRLVGSDGTTRVDVAETAFGGANLRILQRDVTRAQLVSGTRDPESVGFNLYDTGGQRRVWLALKQGRAVGTTG